MIEFIIAAVHFSVQEPKFDNVIRLSSLDGHHGRDKEAENNDGRT